ncbi:hypothetical protein EF294_03650 [Gordonia oryzae]|uniref:Uncharacterized protein n=1 Tax=Gordonia oryzae TaxID=2487349 RepID=A0A3N4HFY7_9ACTN|nr:hypothetical protein [Gordonia oryzae]RPA65844.1 hypothetical protein EF294_03650 [Gordonia oryzae]
MTTTKLPVQKQPPLLEDLVEPLKEILKTGLPVSFDFGDMNLLALRGVVARSVMPHDRLSRIKALNELLARLLVHYPDDSLGEAARIVFGLAPGVRGLTLTQRRERAASEIEREADHFRKRIEPKIVRELARQLHSDSQNYVPRTTPTPEPVEVSGDTPYIAVGDVASHDKALREEAVSRLWANVYALRAEILRVERLKNWPYDPTEPQLSQDKLHEALKARTSARTDAQRAIQEFVADHGSAITSGAAEFNVEGLERLVRWNT